jgi:RNA polymerase sigma-70 factor (ECF subfamily)
MAERPSQAYRVLLAQSGDRAALASLLEEIQDALYGYIHGLVSDRHLAEDVLQDVFVLICRNLIWLREPEVFRPWAFRIASREAFRRLRKERCWGRTIDVTLAPEVPAPVETSDESVSEQLQRLPGLIDSVSLASRVVLILHYREGLSLEEVASVLDLAVGTVKSRLAYGLAVLRKAVAREETLAAATQVKP